MHLDPSARPLIFGEVLFDRFTDPVTDQTTETLGGAPFNVAWHLHALGAGPRVVSRLGTDALGARIRAAMQEWGMDTGLLSTDPHHPTGTVEVRVEQGEPSYAILAERAYDFIDVADLPGIAPGTLLYHGTLAARHPVSAAALRALRATPGLAVFVDVNLRSPWWTAESAAALIGGATWVKLNAEELTLLAPPGGDVEQRARRLVDAQQLAAAFVTLGAEGALAVTAEGESLRLPSAPVARFVDTVGAGDGFAAVLILGLLRGWPLAETLRRAQGFASAILGQRGATGTDPAFYLEFTQHWAQP